jgi:hypothetical protein
MGPVSGRTPVAVPHEAAPSIPFALGAAGTWWLVATAVFSLLVYYFVGVDQGAVSVFGNEELIAYPQLVSLGIRTMATSHRG